MFIPYKYHGSMPDSWELQPVTAGLALDVGVALAMTDGKLVKAAGTVKPTYICMQKIAQTGADQRIHVARVNPHTVYETELSVESAAIKAGVRYTLDDTGEKITATDTGGVAEVIDFDGTAAGSKVRVRF